MKLLLETTGQFMLSHHGDEVQAERPSVVSNTNFFNHRIALGQVKILGKLTDDASDQEFLKYVVDSDWDLPLAVDSFLSKFGVVDVTTKVDQPQAELPLDVKPTARGRAK